MEESRAKSSRPKSRQSIAHLPPTDNTTTDIAALKKKSSSANTSKRSRGKSLGPGVLEALTEADINVTLTTPAFQPKSILKPAIPLTPPKNIPSFDELRKRNTGKAKSPAKNGAEDLLIDFSTPGPSREQGTNVTMTGADALVDPFSPIIKSPKSSKSQPQHHNGKNEQEEEERRRKEKQAALDQRAARRKSMANRRVSFAPEATLHTWSVMELAEDSTTSSASNSTRRQSSMTSAQSPAATMPSPGKSSDPVDPPSTPPKQTAEPLIKASPEHQRDLHQKKRRRSSEASQDSGDEVFSSPGDVGESSPIRVEESIDSDSDSDGDTAMSIEDATSNTVRSSGSSDTQSSLDERLRMAATQAGTRGITYDEHGSDDDDDEEESMELADGTVTHAFRQYARKSHQVPSKNLPATIEDQENIDPSLQNKPQHAEADDDGMTMEMTRMMGGIVSKASRDQQMSVTNRRSSSIGRRRSSGGESAYGDESMDLTTVKGGILDHPSQREDEDEYASSCDGEMTMEFTNVFGSVQTGNHKRESMLNLAAEDTESMDMTAAAGGILEPIEEQTEPQTDVEDRTYAMDMTRAVGQILSSAMERGQLEKHITSSKTQTPTQRPRVPSESPGVQLTTIASETGSPTLKPRLSGRRNAPGSKSTTPKGQPAQSSPSRTASIRVQTTPSTQPKVKTPRGTMIGASASMKVPSPKKLFSTEIKARASPAAGAKTDALFSQDTTTGQHAPRVVLHAPKPHQHLRRRSSGVGIDNEGFGSPRVSEILSRRTSIGENVPEFKLDSARKGRLRFEDPRQIGQEIDADRAEEQRRESGRVVMEQEADNGNEENNTLQLREMIESMTPKKEKITRLKGRKSLAVGSAKGLLGKRPVELDDNEDDASGGTPKRLKAVSREGSPVKKVHLPKPPSKEETTGRLTRAEQRLLGASSDGNCTPAISQSPIKNPLSPSHTGRFKDTTETISTAKPSSFETKLDNVIGAIDVTTTRPDNARAQPEDEKISLQQFLNMTNIHFIELSTTKRRHTMAQSMPMQKSLDMNSSSIACFVTAATTLPLLELYQHATRELKTYISSGRKVIREIEAETLAEQPILFKEYVEARPDVKAIMDNQFRNGKTYARLQSKEGWYAWRSQLVDGLHSGLEGIKADIVVDLSVLENQQTTLQQAASNLISKKDSLSQELHALQTKLEQLNSVDRESLEEQRCKLSQADQESVQKSTLLKELEQQMEDKVETLAQASELKSEMQSQIAEANRVREEHRRWPSREVSALKAKVDNVERQSGWSLLTAEDDVDESNEYGVAITMVYKCLLRLFFYPSAFHASSESSRRRSGRKSRSISGPNAPISLTYSADNHGESVLVNNLPTECRFFLQSIKSQLQTFSMMPKGAVSSNTIIHTVSAGWDLAQQVSSEIQCLSTVGIARTSICGDNKLAAQLMLLQPDRSRIDITFLLSVTSLNDGNFSATTSVSATTAYGSVMALLDSSKMRKVQAALNKEIECKPLGDGVWLGAVRAFEDWLYAQTHPPSQQSREHQQQPVQQPNAIYDEPQTERTEVAKSPVPSKQSITPSAVKRSPLAPRTANTKIQKKALPIPTQRKLWQNEATPMEKPSIVTAQVVREKSQDRQKENDMPFDAFSGVKPPAIPPEMQEAMMHTPVKRRVGALRRSPI